MNRTLRPIRAGFLAFTLAIAAAGPLVAKGVGVAKEWTQLANNAELAVIAGLESDILKTETTSLAKQIQQLQTQISSYELMLRNIKSLPAQHLRDATRPILQLQQIGERAGLVAASGASLDTFLRSGLIEDPLYEQSGLERARLAERYNDWQGQWDSTLETSLSNANLTLADVQSEAQLLQQISSRFGNEVGQMQVLQGANQLAAAMSRHLGGLRAITATQVEQNAIAWSRVLANMDRDEAADRRHEREVQETIEALDNADQGRTIREIFLD
ncbi:MAG: hypothetical protein OXC63_08290 [Aestuariivita sp.]|nr:hypothetical protein [Aestuariivita sp.]